MSKGFKWPIYVLLLCSVGSISQTVSSNTREFPNAAGRKATPPVKVIGTFMKVKSDGEHASGYSVALWKSKNEIYGLISVHRGLMGDPPAGILEDVRFDEKTKKISFRSKLTLGLFYDKNKSTNVPSRDLLEFQGTLVRNSLSGQLIVCNQLCPDGCPTKKEVHLPYSKEWTEGMDQYGDYAEWKAFADEILHRRGPGW